MKSIKRHKVTIIVVSIIVAFILFALVSYAIDFQLIKSNNDPIFARHYDELNDGGTKIFYGLGYNIVKWHRITTHNENPSYICGWDINAGYDDKNTVSRGPNPEQTYNYHFE